MAPHFIRIHRFYVVNLIKVAQLTRDGRIHQLELEDGTVLPTSSTYLPRLKALRD